MKMRFAPYGLCLVLAACGAKGASTEPSNTDTASAGSTAAAPAHGDPPFAIAPVATFDNPWAAAFLPASTTAIITEKPGKIWLVDTKTGVKQAVAGAPRVVSNGQGGLLDVAVSPTFATDNQVYLTYAEPSSNGGSGLALARAVLVKTAAGGHLQGLTVLWHDPAGGQ